VWSGRGLLLLFTGFAQGGNGLRRRLYRLRIFLARGALVVDAPHPIRAQTPSPVSEVTLARPHGAPDGGTTWNRQGNAAARAIAGGRLCLQVRARTFVR